MEGVLVDWSLDQPVDLQGLPVELLSRKQVAAELVRRQRRQAMDAAYEAELILRLAELTPDDHDPEPGSPGARRPGWGRGSAADGVSEFFAGELALVLNRGRGTADHLHRRAQAWRETLPATFAALAAGELDLSRAAALADVLGSTTPALAQSIEALLLPEAVDLSVARLRARALELLLELDATAAAERREEAKRSADVFLQPGQDGMATLGAELSADEATEAYAQIDQLARLARADGDTRPIAQLRTELFSLLLRRPGGHGQPLPAGGRGRPPPPPPPPGAPRLFPPGGAGPRGPRPARGPPPACPPPPISTPSRAAPHGRARSTGWRSPPNTLATCSRASV